MIILIVRLVFGQSVAGWADPMLWGILPAAIAIALRQILYQITDWRLKPVIIATTVVHIVYIVAAICVLPSLDTWQYLVGTFLFVMTMIGTLKYRYKSVFMLLLCMLSGFLLY